jgi:hypothetical protein
MLGLFDIMDEAIATELGVDIKTYIDVIENRCTYEEAKLIIDNIWDEDGNPDLAKELFNEKLKGE